MATIRELVDRWMSQDKNEATRAEIRQLSEANEEEELVARLSTRMEFGTAGLRAAMGAGYSRMNQLTIIQTTQGLCKYILKQFCDAKSRGVVVGMDARHNSEIFSKLTAAIFLRKGFKVYRFSKITPTPFVPYAVKKYGCVAGVMITASHNPKKDNGYKLYWNNGAQIIPPIDKGVAQSITENLEVWPDSWDTSIVNSSLETYFDPYDSVYDCYYQDLKSSAFQREANENTTIKFTYTPLHGVGQKFAEAAFEAFNLPPFVSVSDQMHPDPEFPTVVFPNPEEGRSALELAMQTADQNGSKIILANDPDADRLAIAENINGTWKVLNGNEVGALLAKWLFDGYKQKLAEEGKPLIGDEVWIMNSTVSSRLLCSMARVEGIQHEETLTGFKWMGNLSHDKLVKGHTVLFAFEEAIGFMCQSNVLDKDGISAMAIGAECATRLYSEGRTLSAELLNIYQKYGLHQSHNSYYICKEKSLVRQIFQAIRDNKYGPQSLALPNSNSSSEVKVTNIRDLTIGYDTSTPDKLPKLPTDSNSQFITWEFDNLCVFTLRTSGTEPKIKYYCEMWSEPGKSLNAPHDVAAMARLCVGTFLKPDTYQLQSRQE